MSNCASVKAQLNSIMEALTNAAVAEINKLFEDSSAVLFLEISRNQRENQVLRKKLQLVESELRSTEAGGNGNTVSRAVEDWAAETEEGPALIKEERCEEDSGDGDPHTPWDPVTERGAAEDLGCSHWMSTPPDAQPRSAGGAGELGEDDEGGSDTDDSHGSDTPGKDSGRLGLRPRLQRWPSNTTTIKEETLVLPAWGEEAGPEAVLSEEAGPVVVHFQEAGLGAVDSDEAGPGVVRSAEAGLGIVYSEEAGLRIVYSEEAGLRIAHEQPGAGVKPHHCKYCEKRFTRARDLRVHELTHTEQKSLSCAQCGKTFARRYYLRIHQRYHTGEKLLKCAQCDMSFACQHHLRQHQKCHSGEKPFRCVTCGKDFSRKYNLKEHEKIHTGERPYVCAACGKSFKQLSTLKTHQRSHNGETFSCVCGKSFNRKYVLKVHQRIHTGERPYSCEQCGKSFTQPCVLRSHMRIHAGRNLPAAFRNASVI